MADVRHSDKYSGVKWYNIEIPDTGIPSDLPQGIEAEAFASTSGW